MKPYLIGLTGNIACGKSTVVNLLKELGAQTIDADAVTHLLQAPGQAVYAAIVEAFGEQILTEPNGPINRKALGAIVFSDPAELRKLEQLVHPAVRQYIHAWIADLPQQDPPVVGVLDAIKLLESGWQAHCDAVWVVSCTKEQQLERLITTRGMTEQEALTRINAQPPQSEKIAQADVVIDNSGSLESTKQQILAAWQQIPGRSA
jgi:dephospho-CoA kinase